jgi:hypothetical protein
MTPQPATYYRHRFPAEIVSHAVWLYHVFSLSRRDVGKRKRMTAASADFCSRVMVYAFQLHGSSASILLMG